MANFHLFGEVAKTKRNEKDNNKTTKKEKNYKKQSGIKQKRA